MGKDRSKGNMEGDDLSGLGEMNLNMQKAIMEERARAERLRREKEKQKNPAPGQPMVKP